MYFRPVKTAFPIRFKLRPENDKGSQTEKQYVLPYPSKFFSDLNEGVGQQEMPHHNLDPRGYQWGDNNCDYNFNISNEYGSRTPVENTAGALFDYGPGVEVVSDWFTVRTLITFKKVEKNSGQLCAATDRCVVRPCQGER